MKIVLFSLALLTTQLCNAQDFLWALTTAHSNNTRISSIRKDYQDNLYIAYYIDSTGFASGNRLEKRDAMQNILWTFDIGGGGKVVDMEINSSNHLVVTGSFPDTVIIGIDTILSPGYESAYILEMDENGLPLWWQEFNPNNDIFTPVDLFIDKHDNIYMTASIAGNNGSCSFHKLDAGGNILMNEFNGNFEDRTFSHIIADDNGNVYISGTCGNFATFDSLVSNPNDSYQNVLLKYDSAFNAQWIITRPYITFDHNNGLGADGQYLYWGFLQAYMNTDTIRLVKVDHSGNILLDTPGPLADAFFPSVNMVTDSSSNSTLLCSIYSRLFLYRFDDQFNQTYHDTIYTHISGFPVEAPIAAYDSSFYIGSRYFLDSLMVGPFLLLNQNAANFGSDVFIAKWGYDSNVGIDKIDNHLLKIYPNPVTSTLHFNSEMNDGYFQLFDNTGRIVLSEKISTQKNQVDLSAIARGTYVARFTSNAAVFTGKIVKQ